MHASAGNTDGPVQQAMLYCTETQTDTKTGAGGVHSKHAHLSAAATASLQFLAQLLYIFCQNGILLLQQLGTFVDLLHHMADVLNVIVDVLSKSVQERSSSKQAEHWADT